MRLIRSADHTLRQYVLGELRDAPRLEIEERLIMDPDVFEALGVAEQELAEEYLEGTLSAADRVRFERHYLTSRDRQRHVAFVRLLKSHAAARRPAAGTSSSQHRISDLIRFHRAWAIAAAAVVVLLIGGNLWFLMWNFTLQGQFDQVRVRQGREDELRQQLEGQLAVLTAQANSLQARLESQRMGTNQPATFGLTAGRLRGTERSITHITVPAGAQHVRLQLQLPGEDSSPYRAVLLDEAGDDIWLQSKLKAEAIPGHAGVVVMIPAQLLAPGEYSLKLSGAAARPELEVVATYWFRVDVP